MSRFKARINEFINEEQVRVIDEEGKQIGVINTREAINLASSKGLDLVEISKSEGYSVCKIVDYSKYRYEKERTEKENRKKQKNVVIKEIKVSPNIGVHDLEIKKKKIIELLEKDNKVKVLLVLRGREKLYADKGISMLEEIGNSLLNIAIVEKQYTLQKQLILSPKKVKEI